MINSSILKEMNNILKNKNSISDLSEKEYSMLLCLVVFIALKFDYNSYYYFVCSISNLNLFDEFLKKAKLDLRKRGDNE